MSLELRDVHVHAKSGRGTAHILRGVSFAARPGALSLIIGPSGSGKSTLLAVMGLLLSASRGAVRFRSDRVDHWPAGERERLRLRSIGFVFQQPYLIRGLTVLENVMVPALAVGTPWAEARDAAERLVERLALGELRTAWPGSLSGGEAQRVAIARCLVNRPAVVLADEPTASLDSENVERVAALLRGAAREQGVAVVLVTHDPRLSRSADEAYVMSDGVLSRREAA